MASTYLSPRHVLHLAKVVEAVQEGRRVAFVDYDSNRVEGTLRGFTPKNSGVHFSGGDIRDSYVRITLVQGGDVWIETEELTGLLEEGSLAL